MKGSAKATRAISPRADLITDSGLVSGRGRRGVGRSCLQRIGVDILFRGKVSKRAHYSVRSRSAQRAGARTTCRRFTSILARFSRQVPINAGRDAGESQARCLRSVGPALRYATVILSDKYTSWI